MLKITLLKTTKDTAQTDRDVLMKPATSAEPIITKAFSFRLEIFKEPQAVAEAAATLLLQHISVNPKCVLLLPTGRTPLAMYAAMVERLQQKPLKLELVQSFNLDEFYGIPADHPGSYHTYMRNALFDHIAVPQANLHLLNGMAASPEAECAAYEAQIEAAGGIDLGVLGIGANGHIGFNEPGSEVTSRSHRVALQPGSRAANSYLFNDELESVPESALTVGIATIMEARQILLLATGPEKASALAALMHGAITPKLPASYLRLHHSVLILADEAAASEL
ncbi:MAG TPA: glucosamine-6-phosphate deaminase [Chloroflexia bacterium]|nr:glucosamine-6-phosphate deaminase [Chloroflexia bacterium]